jgi:hypothetical protein
MRSHAKTVEKLARRYWSAEAEIMRAYFRKPRRKKEHCHWLKARRNHSAGPHLTTVANLEGWGEETACAPRRVYG